MVEHSFLKALRTDVVVFLIAAIYFLAGPSINAAFCRFNLNKWLFISATNFYTAQVLFMLLMVLVSYSRESYRKPIAVITGLYYCGYLPFMGVYDLFGGFAINNSDTSVALSSGSSCVS